MLFLCRLSSALLTCRVHELFAVLSRIWHAGPSTSAPAAAEDEDDLILMEEAPAAEQQTTGKKRAADDNGSDVPGPSKRQRGDGGVDDAICLD